MRPTLRFQILLVVVCLLGAGNSLAGIVQGTIKIHGKLTAGVKLEVQYGDQKIQKSVTDKNGRFRLNVPQAGSCQLVIFLGDQSYATTIQVHSTAVSYNLDLARNRSGKDRLVKR